MHRLTTLPFALLALAACHESSGGHGRGDNLPARVGTGSSGGNKQCNAPPSTVAPPTLVAAPQPVVPAGTFHGAAAHPRLFWTPDRIAHAKQVLGHSNFAPRDDDIAGNVTLCAITKDSTAGKIASAFLAKVMSENLLGNADHARWDGENAILAYDWCFDQLPPAQRDAFVAYANTWFDHWNHESWGSVGQEESNYYWGYLRNSAEWGIASSPENPKAQALLDDALVTRWEKSFLPFAQTTEKGGVPMEGTQYGRYQETYGLVPFLTLTTGGRKIFDETDWYRSAVYYNIYNTPPGATTRGDYHGVDAFPAEDDEQWLDGNSTAPAYGDLMTAMAMTWPDRAVGRDARSWLTKYKPERSPYLSGSDPGGAATDFSTLPLDYFAPGPGFLWARDNWSSSASVVFAQFGFPNGSGHQHLDAGSFQLWRKGRWMSRETVAYTDEIVGYNGVKTGARQGIGHNAILFGGRGMANAYFDGPAKIVRLESRKDYAFIAADLSGVYRAKSSGHADRDDNPFASKLVRELLYVRDLDAIVVFDRMESSSDSAGRRGWTGGSLTAEQVPKTFLLHFETTAKPKLAGGNGIVSTNGDQVLKLTTLVPAAPVYRIVDERLKPDDKIGQYRVEVDTSGAAQSYFVNVIQLRDANAPDLAASVSETVDSFTITLGTAQRGATISLSKGMQSAGGSITTDSCGAHALTDYVQQISVGDDGPVWGP